MKIQMEKQNFLLFNIDGGRKPHHDVHGILTRYHLIFDPYLGIGRCSIRIIPCCFIECRYDIYLTWNTYISPKYQSRFASETE